MTRCTRRKKLCPCLAVSRETKGALGARCPARLRVKNGRDRLPCGQNYASQALIGVRVCFRKFEFGNQPCNPARRYSPVKLKDRFWSHFRIVFSRPTESATARSRRNH